MEKLLANEFSPEMAIIILQEIEQFASLMVFDLDNQASSVNNIYDWYEVNEQQQQPFLDGN